MDRLAYFEIAGKKYPLSFSLMAEKTMAARYGSLSKMGEVLDGDNEKTFSELAFILELLIRQGCAYKNMFESNLPHCENAPVEDGKWIPLTEEQIYVGVNAHNQKDMMIAIKKAMGVGQRQEIETAEKNLETQGEEGALHILTSGEES